MRTFGRKLVATPLLIAMALMAVGVPATARAVHRQNSAQACCAAGDCRRGENPAPSDRDTCTARRSKDATGMDETECCPGAPVACGVSQCDASCEPNRDQDSSASPATCCAVGRGASRCAR